MDIIQNLNLVNAGELMLIALICYTLTAGIKKTRIKNAYMPFISMVVGIFVGIIVAWAFHDADIVKAGIAGFLVGGWTAGLFTGIKGAFGGYELESSSTKVDEAPQLNEVTAPKYGASVNTRRN